MNPVSGVPLEPQEPAGVLDRLAGRKYLDVTFSRSELPVSNGGGFNLSECRMALALRHPGPGTGDDGQGLWYDWVFARILLREAAAMVEK